MLIRPFSVYLVYSDNIENTTVHCVFDDLALEQRLLVENKLNKLFSAIGLIGKWGGLAGTKNDPRNSCLTILDNKRETKNSSYWLLSHSNIDPGFIYIIENILHSLALTSQFLKTLYVETGLASPDTNLWKHLPGYFEPLPFEFFYETLMPQVVVEADFVGRQNTENLEIFREVVDAWYLIASTGGFADDYFPPVEQMTIFIENELQITSIGMQVVFDDVMISEKGFCIFVNLLTYFHHNLAKLSNVSIS